MGALAVIIIKNALVDALQIRRLSAWIHCLVEQPSALPLIGFDKWDERSSMAPLLKEGPFLNTEKKCAYFRALHSSIYAFYVSSGKFNAGGAVIVLIMCATSTVALFINLLLYAD